MMLMITALNLTHSAAVRPALLHVYREYSVRK